MKRHNTGGAAAPDVSGVPAVPAVPGRPSADVPDVPKAPKPASTPRAPHPPRIEVNVHGPITNSVVIVRVNSDGDDGTVTHRIERLATRLERRPHRPVHPRARAASPPSVPHFTPAPARAAPLVVPVAAPATVAPPAPRRAHDRHRARDRVRPRAPAGPPQFPAPDTGTPVLAAATAGAGGGGAGGAGAALAIALGLIALIVPAGLRGLSTAADGPPREPDPVVLERPG